MSFWGMIGRPVEVNKSWVCGELGEEFPYLEVRARRVRLMDEYIRAHGPPLKPGAKELSQWLVSEDIPRIVATSTDTTVARMKLEKASLLPSLNTVIGSDTVETGKPAPDLFLAAAKSLKLHPSECVVIEDSPAGVQAAQAAGMDYIVVPDLVAPEKESVAGALAVAKDLHGALRVIISQVG